MFLRTLEYQRYLIILSIILAFEIFYSINNQIADYPAANTVAGFKKRFENYNWGYNELGDFLKKNSPTRSPPSLLIQI